MSSSGDIAKIYGGAVPTDQPDASTGFDVLPAGWYSVEIESAEIKDTKAGNGKYLKLELTVLSQNFTGRKLFPMITLMNPNTKAVEIGMRDIAGLGQACALQSLSDTSELVNKTLDVRVKVKKGNAGYDDDNSVSAYAPVGSKTGTAQVDAYVEEQIAKGNLPAPKAGAAKRPWER